MSDPTKPPEGDESQDESTPPDRPSRPRLSPSQLRQSGGVGEVLSWIQLEMTDRALGRLRKFILGHAISVSDRIRERLERDRDAGRLDWSDAQILTVSLMCGQSARDAILVTLAATAVDVGRDAREVYGTAISVAFQMGVDRSATQEDHTRPTLEAAPPRRDGDGADDPSEK